MKLNEILDKPTPLQTTRENEKVWAARATFGDREIEFKLGKWPAPNDNKWNFYFVELGEEHEDGETFNATGKGNELAVFATAKKFLEMSIQKYKPNVIYFEADKSKGGSRAQLYRKFAKRWAPPGYTHAIVHDDEHADYHAFIENAFYKKTYGK